MRLVLGVRTRSSCLARSTATGATLQQLQQLSTASLAAVTGATAALQQLQQLPTASLAAMRVTAAWCYACVRTRSNLRCSAAVAAVAGQLLQLLQQRAASCVALGVHQVHQGALC